MTTQSKASTKTIKPKTPAPSRTRVKELTIARLEALAEKQARRLPNIAAPAAERGEFTNRRAARLTQHLCLMAVLRKRRSLKRALPMAFVHWRLEADGEADPELPRDAKTDAAVRALGRAGAILTRLVWRGAEAEARREMEAKEAQEADASR